MLIADLCLPGQTTCIKDPLATSGTSPFTTPADIISRALTFIFPIAGLILFINLIWAGYQYLASQGDQKAMDSARGRITNSLLGFILLVVAVWITQAIARILKIQGPF